MPVGWVAGSRFALLRLAAHATAGRTHRHQHHPDPPLIFASIVSGASWRALGEDLAVGCGAGDWVVLTFPRANSDRRCARWAFSTLGGTYALFSQSCKCMPPPYSFRSSTSCGGAGRVMAAWHTALHCAKRTWAAPMGVECPAEEGVELMASCTSETPQVATARTASCGRRG